MFRIVGDTNLNNSSELHHINTSMFKLNNFSKPKAIYNPGKGRSHRCGHTFFNCGVHKIEDTLKNDT
jgi:hypothetical protein